MTEAEWLACKDPMPMLEFVESLPAERKLRLFACACCRLVWDFLADERSRTAVEVAEGFADGLNSDTRLMEASRAGNDAYLNHRSVLYSDAAYAALMTCTKWVRDAAKLASTHSICSTITRRIKEEKETPANLVGTRVRAEEKGKLACLLRDIFGNPFRPVAFPPEWRTDTAVALARQMYDSRDFSAMPILADALQDAGCDNEDILTHCRGPVPHVRGCWVVDLVLGKE